MLFTGRDSVNALVVYSYLSIQFHLLVLIFESGVKIDKILELLLDADTGIDSDEAEENMPIL